MGVSENSGTPKSSILIGFSIINYLFWGIPILGNIRIVGVKKLAKKEFAKDKGYTKKIGKVLER